MEIISKSCRRTYRALQENTCGEVPAECIAPLLHWVCGSRSGPAETVYRILGSPFDDAVQLERVYRALDAALFDHGELRLPDGNVETRRDHYRLLSRAFHPDRHPHLSGWLEPREQTINAAFHVFRKVKEVPAGSEPPAGRGQAGTRVPVRQSEESYSRIGLRERFINLCAPLAYSRYLPQKILAVTAILCALPLLYLYRQHTQMEAYSYAWTAPIAQAEMPATAGRAAAPPGADASPSAAPAPAGVTLPVRPPVAEALMTTAAIAPVLAARPGDARDSTAPVPRAVAVMARFRSNFEHGDLQELLALIAANPRENENSGRSWFRHSYGELFRHTQSRALELDFSGRYRDGGAVRLVGRYAMQITYTNGHTASGSGPVQYRLVPEDGQWKISAIDYRRER